MVLETAIRVVGSRNETVEPGPVTDETQVPAAPSGGVSGEPAPRTPRTAAGKPPPAAAPARRDQPAAGGTTVSETTAPGKTKKTRTAATEAVHARPEDAGPAERPAKHPAHAAGPARETQTRRPAAEPAASRAAGSLPTPARAEERRPGAERKTAGAGVSRGKRGSTEKTRSRHRSDPRRTTANTTGPRETKGPTPNAQPAARVPETPEASEIRRLTPASIMSIRERAQEREPVRRIAQSFGISVGAVMRLSGTTTPRMAPEAKPRGQVVDETGPGRNATKL